MIKENANQNVNKNLLPQKLYDIFEEKMKHTKTDFNFNDWAIEYNLLRRIVLCVFIYSLIDVVLQTFFSQLVVYWVNFSIIIFSLFEICLAINNYYESKKNNAKKAANKIIDSILKREGIIIKEAVLETLINFSADIGSEKKKYWFYLKKSETFKILRAFIVFYFGIITGILSNIISNKNFLNQIEVWKVFFSIFDILLVFTVVTVVIYNILFWVEKELLYYSELYIEVLKDRQFSLALKREESFLYKIKNIFS